MNDAPTVQLTPISETDLPLLFKWINDRELVSLNARFKPISWEQHLDWFASLANRPDLRVFAISTAEENRLIGTCQLRHIDPGHGTAELVIRIGEQNLFGKGYGTQALILLCKHAFDVLGLQRIGLRVFADNLRAIRAYRKIGFRNEGRLRQAVEIEGQRKDMLIMGLLREDFIEAAPKESIVSQPEFTLTKSPILVLCPHTDDGELGCGGFISKCREQNLEIWYAAFSNAWQSLPKGLPKDTLLTEVRAATRSLGIDEDHLLLYDFPVRKFDEFRQDILETLVKLRAQLQPQLVLIPSLRDLHQDHCVIAMEATRCFKTISILSYEMPWNNISFSSDCFVRLEDRHVQAKINALHCYKSQGHRTYLTEEAIRAQLLTRGIQLTGGHAECFEVVRWML
jgi:RimJ/RimL family protein N-acetyltransferase/LmbE family N-acetylglucosaminyl deacetylase